MLIIVLKRSIGPVCGKANCLRLPAEISPGTIRKYTFLKRIKGFAEKIILLRPKRKKVSATYQFHNFYATNCDNIRHPKTCQKTIAFFHFQNTICCANCQKHVKKHRLSESAFMISATAMFHCLSMKDLMP